MNQEVWSLTIGLIFSFLHMISVAITLKVQKHIAPVLVHAASALVYLILLSFSRLFYAFELWIAFSTFAFCVSSYLFAFGVVYKSLTLRMLCASYLNGGNISIDELDSTITTPTFTDRVVLLNKMKRVRAEKEQYGLTEQGKKTANGFSAIRRIFRITTKAVYHNKQ